MHRGLVFMALLLISLVPLESNASMIEMYSMYRKLAEGGNPKVPPMQISPAPIPIPSINSNSGGAGGDHLPANPPEPIVTEICEMASNRCPYGNNMTACVKNAGPQGLFLLVMNDGESSLNVNVTFLPVNTTYEEIHIPRHQAKKINISEDVGRDSTIVLNTGNGDCVIHMVARGPQDFYQLIPSYVTPINGAYVLFVVAITIGGTWACCKLGKEERILDGVPYKELEMGQPEFLSSGNVEGWDQGWDDDWDEEKAVKSTGGNHEGSRPENGLPRYSNSDGWGNDWDD